MGKIKTKLVTRTLHLPLLPLPLPVATTTTNTVPGIQKSKTISQATVALESIESTVNVDIGK